MGTVLALAALATVALQISAAHANHVPRRAIPRVAATQSPVISKRLLATFGVLRQRRARAATVPSQLAVPGVETGAAKQVQASNGISLWVVPGANKICVEDATYAGVCGTVSSADSGSLIMLTGDANGAHTVIGLVPDGNSSVALHHPDGSTSTVPVVNNVYSVSAADLDGVTVHTASGTASTYHVGAGRAPAG